MSNLNHHGGKRPNDDELDRAVTKVLVGVFVVIVVVIVVTVFHAGS